MYTALLLSALGAVAVNGQGVPPPPGTLTATMSGAVPSLSPFPTAGLETEEGALVNDGPANPSFQPINGPAATQTGLPAATFVATLPAISFDNLTGTDISGTVTASASQGATGVTFQVNLSNLPPASYGPFVYHIHGAAVPADGNCSATGGHLDPTDRGEYYPCNSPAPDTCQAGDLAGKHGNITGSTFTASYTDDFLSTDPSSPYYFGGLALVIHSNNATRLTCANFLQVSSSNSSTGGASSTGATGVSPASSTSTVTPFTGAGMRLTAGAGAVAAVVLGAVALL